MKKFLNFIKSFQYIGLEEKFKIIVFGPEAKSYLKYFKRNFYYIEPTKKTIFNFKLIIPCCFFFIFFFIKKPILTIKYLKISPKLFLLISFIRINKIDKIITLVDYNAWPVVLKKFLGNKIYYISLQNSSKAYPLSRALLAKECDEYYYWNKFKDCEKKKLSSTKLFPLGALKSHLVVNDKNLWNIIKSLPESTNTNEKKNLVLISTVHTVYKKFYEKYIKNFSIKHIEKNLQDLEKKCLKRKFFGKIKLIEKKQTIPYRMFYYQSLEFFKMCIFVKKYVDENKVNLSIIERNSKGSEMYDFEKDIFQKLFGKNYLTSLDSFEKIEYVIKNKKHLFLTNISTLGREALALNRKSFFFSTLSHHYNPDFFDKNSDFFSMNDDFEDFKKSLNSIFASTSKNFSESKTKLKFTVPSCEIIKDDFEKFLTSTGLEIK